MKKLLLNDQLSFGRMRSIFFFGLITLLSIAMIFLFRSFLYPIFWAAVLAIIFYPMHKRFGHLIKHPTPQALFSLFIIVIIIFIPLSILSALIVDQSFALYQNISKSSVFQNPSQVSNWLDHSMIGPYISDIRQEWTGYFQQITKSLSSIIFNSVKSITQNSLRFILMTFIMLYTLYYFLKDGPKILKRLMHLSPLGDKYETMLYERFTSTTRATLKSTLIVGGIQGFLSGMLFWITGIQGAFVWGVIMVIIAIIPAIGTPVVLIPAAIIMLVLGNVWQGITLLIGALVVSFIDNLIRPPLVGKDIQMHPLVVFFATLGGLIIFGVSGFVIGPIIAALYTSIMSIYEHYYKTELENN